MGHASGWGECSGGRVVQFRRAESTIHIVHAAGEKNLATWQQNADVVGAAVGVREVARRRGRAEYRVIKLRSIQSVAVVIDASSDQHLAVRRGRIQGQLD